MTAKGPRRAALVRAMSRSQSPFYGPDLPLPLRTCAHCRRLFRAVSRTETCCSLTCADARGSTMSPLPVTDAVIVAAPSADETAERIAFWRGEARACLEIGMTETARVCETRASNLDWEPVPCSA
jgi:hypothetical protein